LCDWPHIEGETQAEEVREQDVEKVIWGKEVGVNRGVEKTT
jgi:hypothetical protein